MENNHKSDTLRQRQKAQQDFLELKKMQSGEIKPPQKPSEIYQSPQGAAKVKNFWDYNKWFILGGLLIAAVIAFVVAKCAATPQYDLRVLAYTSEILSDQDCYAIEDYLKPLCEDITGDGEVYVQVINCSFSVETSTNEHKYSNQTKIQGIISAEPDVLLYITDQDTHTFLSNIGNDVKLIEGDHSPLGEKFYRECDTADDITLPKGLQAGIRTIKGTTIQSDKNIETYSKQAERVLEKLTKE